MIDVEPLARRLLLALALGVVAKHARPVLRALAVAEHRDDQHTCAPCALKRDLAATRVDGVVQVGRDVDGVVVGAAQAVPRRIRRASAPAVRAQIGLAVEMRPEPTCTRCSTSAQKVSASTETHGACALTL